MTYVDLTDLVSNSLWYDSFTGIQRVQLTTAHLLAKNHTCACYSLFEGTWVDLNPILRSTHGDADAFTGAIRQLYPRSSRSASQDWFGLSSLTFRLRRRILRSVHKVRGKTELKRRVRKGDVIVAMGCYWQLSYLLDFYEYLASIGANFICFTHDIFPIRSKGGHGNRSIAPYMTRFYKLPALHVANSVFTRSEMIAAHCASQVKIARRDITVVPLAQQFFGVARNHRSARPVRLQAAVGNEPYVLVVGNGLRKNHQLALAVWSHLKDASGKPLPALVFAGGDADAVSVRNVAEALWLERPSEDELAGLYANCLFTLFPSIEEGWGLPVGESLWFGKLCVSSNGGALPEVGGEYALYFDPDSLDDCLRAVRLALNDTTRAHWEQSILRAPLREWGEVGHDMVLTIDTLRHSSIDLEGPTSDLRSRADLVFQDKLDAEL
ncbi:glycosyltransferase [Bradyrhizobium sp. P5_C11_2]